MDCKQRKVGSIDLFETPGQGDMGAVLLFHGFGADAQDLLPLATLYPDFRWIFPNGPLKISIAPGHMGRAWFDLDIELLQQAVQCNDVKQAFPKELTQAKALGEELIAELDIPLSELFIGGFSQGAVLATEMALNSPHTLAGLLVLSGTLINEEKWAKMAPIHGGMPFFQSHGHQDPLLPFEQAQNLEHLLQKGGLRGKLHAFMGGHEIPQSICQKLTIFFKKLTHSV